MYQCQNTYLRYDFSEDPMVAPMNTTLSLDSFSTENRKVLMAPEDPVLVKLKLGI